MVFAANGFVGDPRFVEHRAKLGVQARIVTVPKRTKGISVLTGQPAGIRFKPIAVREGKFSDQIDVAVTAVREPGAVLNQTLWAKHNRESNTEDSPEVICLCLCLSSGTRALQWLTNCLQPDKN